MKFTVIIGTIGFVLWTIFVFSNTQWLKLPIGMCYGWLLGRVTGQLIVELGERTKFKVLLKTKAAGFKWLVFKYFKFN